MTIDTHFEVILERITQLSNITNTTVWYEIHTDNDHQVLVLINDSNDIGAIVLSYVDNKPELRGYMFGKEIYDDMVKDGFTQKMLITEDTSMSGCPPGDIVSKITKHNQSA